MMKYGISVDAGKSPVVKAAGWDFVEENIQGLLQGQLADDEWKGQDRAKASSLPIPAANCLVPGSLKITGPDADLSKLSDYMTRVLARAPKVGINRLVFGSGGARNVPDGFDRDTARRQIMEFISMSAKLAAEHNVIIFVEPLNRQESNIINSVSEAMEYVRAINHPNIQCLLDTYHFWCEDDSLDIVRSSIPWIGHVHLADKVGRVAPGLSGSADYRPVFRLLKNANYAGLISVEATNFDIAADGKRVLEFVKKSWADA